jgi:5-methyltetrahydropteroyltriglutamate--homocysteine methyltransferase
MASKINPPFRADQVGSLKRPEALQRARERLLGAHDFDHNLGAHNNMELHQLEDGYIKEVVALQESLGLRSITDGDFRRRTWWTDFVLGLQGTAMTMRGTSPLVFIDKSGHSLPLPQITVHGKIAWRGSTMVAAFTYLKSLTTCTPKVMMPAPTNVHYFSQRRNIDAAVYPDLAAFWDDVIQAYRAEFAALSQAGCTYIQMDDVTFAFLCDPKHRDHLRANGEDPDVVLSSYADAINRVLDGRPANLTVAMHICRGNMSGHWAAEGGYDPVADTLFNKINLDAYFLEYDSPRAGTFAPLRYVPANKTIVLGLVSTKTPELETADDLKKRIDEASKYVPLDQLCLSPQCGFSSNYIGNPVTIDDEKKKLSLIVKVAEDVWGSA